MHVYLLSLLFIINTSVGKTPNFYPNFIAAREASKNYNKDLLVFFSKKSCAECDAAWAGFEKDPVASKLYISTSINIQDFDGAVFLDKYGLDNAPAWLILDPQGQVKDKWNGEWKKTTTRPQTTPSVSTQAPEKEMTQKTEAVTAPKIQVPTSASPSAEEQEEIAIAVTPVSETTTAKEQLNVTPAPTETSVEMEAVKQPAAEMTLATTSGYVIQAGFFGSEANARGLVSELDEKGFDNFSTLPADRNGTTFHRVISSVYKTEAEAQIKVEDLQKAGIKATVKSQKEL